jgi:RNA:NAD 2'-phosphotransferase (TPT1/KptA family)
MPAVSIARAGEMPAAGHAFHLSGNGVWLTDTVPAAHIDVGEAALYRPPDTHPPR